MILLLYGYLNTSAIEIENQIRNINCNKKKFMRFFSI